MLSGLRSRRHLRRREAQACIAVRRPPYQTQYRSVAVAVAVGLSCSLLFNVSSAQDFKAHDAELRRQEEQAKAVRRQQEAAPDVHLQPAASAGIAKLQDEEPCRRIREVEVQGASNLGGLARASLGGRDGSDRPEGRCLGPKSIGILLDRATNSLIEAGYITSRVVAPSQDLNDERLTLTIAEGRIGAIRIDSPDDRIADPGVGKRPRPALALREGQLLNLRDVEQTLENLRRNANADADIRIQPGAEEGLSDVVIDLKEGRPIRPSVSVDDGGSEATGRWQSNLTLTWYGPLGLSDLFYVSHSQDVGDASSRPHGSRNDVIHYSLPYGYWLFGATASSGSYHQTVVGPYQSYRYSGSSQYSEFSMSRLIQRGPYSKTGLAVKAFSRGSSNFIDDTEIEVQHRQVGGWEAELHHTHYVDSSVIDLALSYRRGTGAFGAEPAPEECFGEGTSRMQVWQANLYALTPIPSGRLDLQYSAQLRVQGNKTALTPQDRLCLGGRYTVRGFDGEQTVCGERGAFMRNEVSAATGMNSLRLYGGLDFGRVNGSSAPDDAALAGAVLGLRWAGRVSNFGDLQFDAFVGKPLRKPPGFDTARTAAGLSMTASF